MDHVLNDIAAVCRRTHLGRSKVYELLDDGQIESVKVGRRRLIPEESLVAFVERLRSEGAARSSTA